MSNKTISVRVDRKMYNEINERFNSISAPTFINMIVETLINDKEMTGHIMDAMKRKSLRDIATPNPPKKPREPKAKTKEPFHAPWLDNNGPVGNMNLDLSDV